MLEKNMKEWDNLVLNVNILPGQQWIWKKHEVVRYPCSQCEHVATQEGHLKKLVENKNEEDSNYEGVRYHCLQCEYAATDSSNLKSHI